MFPMFCCLSSSEEGMSLVQSSTSLLKESLHAGKEKADRENGERLVKTLVVNFQNVDLHEREKEIIVEAIPIWMEWMWRIDWSSHTKTNSIMEDICICPTIITYHHLSLFISTYHYYHHYHHYHHPYQSSWQPCTLYTHTHTYCPYVDGACVFPYQLIWFAKTRLSLPCASVQWKEMH
jgi:hypothetical protein